MLLTAATSCPPNLRTTWSVGLELTRKMHAYKAGKSPENRSPISHEKGTPSLKRPLDSSSPGPSTA